MTAAYEELLHVLDERDINYSTGEEQSIRTTIRGEVATYFTAARVEDDLFQVACYSPVRIPEGSRRDIAEAIVRANYGLRVGKFELEVAARCWCVTKEPEFFPAGGHKPTLAEPRLQDQGAAGR